MNHKLVKYPKPIFNIIATKAQKFYRIEPKTKVSIPIFESKVSAGFPSPAEDYKETSIDLNEFLIKNQAATFLYRVSGDSMEGAGIRDNSLIIVDRSLTPKSNQIVFAEIDKEYTVKRYIKERDGTIYLKAENPKYKPIKISEGMEFIIWGVVTNAITNFVK